MMRPRKIPLRKCAGCGEMKNKRELIRVVRSQEGEFSLDPTGKKTGRGAYICPNVDCLRKAEKCKGLERSFQQAIPAPIYEQLKVELDG
ncbi:MAG: YlxR family protein [Clostridiales bacterium]|jgi:predicted RNA-binding protein YlxR (DUF448 family)|nr:YlxR family protein [Clostridiales bacterium]